MPAGISPHGGVPCQLIPGDRYNISAGVLLVFLLSTLKGSLAKRLLPSVVRWQLNAYTNWNIAFALLGAALRQRQWEPFLLTNSLAILIGFRTAMAQGLEDNLWKKFRAHNLDLPRWVFRVLDHLSHTAPVLWYVGRCWHGRRRVHPMNVVYCAVLCSYFAFRQQAKLDASDLYVPHSWRRAWFGIATGAVMAPSLVDSLIFKRWRRLAAILAVLMAPWCTTRFDPELRRKYNFEYAAQSTGAPAAAASGRRRNVRMAATPHDDGMLRISSDILSISAPPTA